MDDFEQLIASLVRANPVHSSGQFTLDADAARQKSRYLIDPRLCCLNLVRAAVASGPRVLNILTGRGRVAVGCDGQAWTRAQLEQVTEGGLIGDQGPLHFLAAAAHAAREAGYRVILEGQVRLVGDRKGWQQTAPEARKGNTAELIAPGNALWRFFSGSPETTLLRRHTLYLPFPCGFNRRPLGPPVFGQDPHPTAATSTFAYLGAEFGSRRAFPPGYHLCERYVTAPHWTAGVLAAPTRRHPKIFVGLDREPKIAPVELAHTQALVHDRVPGPPALFGAAPELKYGRPGETLPCFALLALAPELEGPGCLVLVKEGVILGATEEELGCPGALAIVSAAGLTEDLGQFGVVKNAAYEELLAYLRRQFRELLEGLPDWLPRVGNFQTEKSITDRLSSL